MNVKIPLSFVITTALLVLSILPSDSTGSINSGIDDIESIKTTTVDIDFDIEFDPDDLVFDSIQGFEYISSDGFEMNSNPGEPMVPWREIRVSVPHDTISTTIMINDIEGSLLPDHGPIAGVPLPTTDHIQYTDMISGFSIDLKDPILISKLL